jgi:hypothetical protein
MSTTTVPAVGVQAAVAVADKKKQTISANALYRAFSNIISLLVKKSDLLTRA